MIRGGTRENIPAHLPDDFPCIHNSRDIAGTFDSTIRNGSSHKYCRGTVQGMDREEVPTHPSEVSKKPLPVFFLGIETLVIQSTSCFHSMGGGIWYGRRRSAYYLPTARILVTHQHPGAACQGSEECSASHRAACM